MTWVLSIVGVVFVGVVFDLLLPDGKATKFCRTIFGIVLLFVMIYPLGDLLNISSVFTYGYLDSSALNNLNITLVNELENNIESGLSSAGYDGVNVMVSANTSGVDIKIYKIFVDMSGYVLNSMDKHTIEYENIINIILGTVMVDEGGIVIYGY